MNVRKISSSHHEVVLYQLFEDVVGAEPKKIDHGILNPKADNTVVEAEMIASGDLCLLCVATQSGKGFKLTMKDTNIIDIQYRMVFYESVQKQLPSLILRFDSTHRGTTMHHEDAHVGTEDPPPPFM